MCESYRDASASAFKSRLKRDYAGMAFSNPRSTTGRTSLRLIAINFLCVVAPSMLKFSPAIGDVLVRSVLDGCQLGDVESVALRLKRIAQAFNDIEQFALNLVLFPWKKEYHIIKTYSGFYRTSVLPYLHHPESLFQSIGYADTPNILTLPTMPPESQLIDVALDLFLAAEECRLCSEILQRVAGRGFNISHVMRCRQLFTGDINSCVEWILRDLHHTNTGYTLREFTKSDNLAGLARTSDNLSDLRRDLNVVHGETRGAVSISGMDGVIGRPDNLTDSLASVRCVSNNGINMNSVSNRLAFQHVVARSASDGAAVPRDPAVTNGSRSRSNRRSSLGSPALRHRGLHIHTASDAFTEATAEEHQIMSSKWCFRPSTLTTSHSEDVEDKYMDRFHQLRRTSSDQTCKDVLRSRLVEPELLNPSDEVFTPDIDRVEFHNLSIRTEERDEVLSDNLTRFLLQLDPQYMTDANYRKSVSNVINKLT